ncbi:MAG: hypothetical protein ACXW5U_06965 [Thermoanaerobaculia bacterium]
MKFETLDTQVLTQGRKSLMLAVDTKTEIQTEVGGKWVHDANDSDKPIKLSEQ